MHGYIYALLFVSILHLINWLHTKNPRTSIYFNLYIYNNNNVLSAHYFFSSHTHPQSICKKNLQYFTTLFISYRKNKCSRLYSYIYSHSKTSLIELSLYWIKRFYMKLYFFFLPLLPTATLGVLIAFFKLHLVLIFFLWSWASNTRPKYISPQYPMAYFDNWVTFLLFINLDWDKSHILDFTPQEHQTSPPEPPNPYLNLGQKPYPHYTHRTAKQ